MRRAFGTLEFSLIAAALIAAVVVVPSVYGSRGDTSTHFQNCWKQCQRLNCSTDSMVKRFDVRQPLYNKMLGWDCPEECKYECMWKTTSVFEEKMGYVPQFHGKWPFVRLLGIQEPASALFSLMNGLAHVAGFVNIQRSVVPGAPFRSWWLATAGGSVLCWMFSTVFHARDTPLTERLDYAGGMAMNVAALVSLALRMIRQKKLTGVAPSVVLGAAGSFVYRHLKFLFGVEFDYGYNMKVHLLVGSTHVIGWLLWSAVNWRQCPYAWKGALANLLMAASMALELLDFPPLGWVLDAHALWHLTTVPLIFLWYSFVVDDCNALSVRRKEDPKQKTE